MIPYLQSPVAQRLAWTLLHFLWQGTLLGLLAWAAFAMLRSGNPQHRYLVGYFFLVACLGTSLATFELLAQPTPAQPRMLGLALSAPQSVFHLESQPAPVPSTPMEPAVSLPWQARLQPHLPWILAAWALGVLVFGMRVLGGWVWLHRLRATTSPVLEPVWLDRVIHQSGIRRTVRFLESARVVTPLCLGLLRPVVLLPLGFFAHLDPLAAEAVLAHKLAHLRRLDGLFNGIQCVIEVLLFFHPAVWWLSRRIRAEREHCCDDAAVLACGDAVLYAETLSRLDVLREGPRTLALQARGGNLMERLRRLLLSHPPRLDFSMSSLVLLAAVSLLSTLPARARKHEAPPPRAEESAKALVLVAGRPGLETPWTLAPPQAGLAPPLFGTAPRNPMTPALPTAPGQVVTPPLASTARLQVMEPSPGLVAKPAVQAPGGPPAATRVGGQADSPHSMEAQLIAGKSIDGSARKSGEKPAAPSLKLNDEICLLPDNDARPAHWEWIQKSSGDPLDTRPLQHIPPLLTLPKEKRIDASALTFEVDGTAQSISAQRGKVVVLCFVATSCRASLRALELIKHFQTAQKRDDLVLFPLHRFPPGGKAILGPVIAFPMFYILDRRGRIAASFAGYQPDLLTKLLNDYYSEAE